MKSIKSVLTYIGIVLITVILAVLGKLLVRVILTFLGSEAGEFIELVNTAVFLVVGGGFGFAIKKSDSGRFGFIISIALLVPLIVSLYCFNPVIDYREWIEDVAAQQKISYEDAKTLTDAFLRNEVSLSGFIGYYSYTAKAFFWGEKVKERHLLASIVNWGIRIFYLGLSIFFTVFSFKEARGDNL